MEEIICNCWWPQHVNNIRISDHHVSKHIWTYIIFVIRFNRFQRTSVETRGPTKYRGRGRFHLVSVVKHWIRRVRGATARPVCTLVVRQLPDPTDAHRIRCSRIDLIDPDRVVAFLVACGKEENRFVRVVAC